MLEQFRQKVSETEIPAIVKPWFCYEYRMMSDGFKLVLVKYEQIDFYENGDVGITSSREEAVLAEVKCDYLTVEQYAELYNVTTTTVCEWLQRGKLRAAKKNGCDWLIPALADKPKRGFNGVCYEYKKLPQSIVNTFPYLKDSGKLHIHRDYTDKKMFNCLVYYPKKQMSKELKLSAQERERLEVAIIRAPNLRFYVSSTYIKFYAPKRSYSFPMLPSVNAVPTDGFEFEHIIVKPISSGRALVFSPAAQVGVSFDCANPSAYLIPVAIEILGIPGNSRDREAGDKQDVMFAASSVTKNGDYSKSVKIGEFYGHLIHFSQMMSEGVDPLKVAERESGNLEYVIGGLIGEDGPLNDRNGDPYQNVLIIHELVIEEEFRRKRLGSRVLRELPYICRLVLHIRPDIVAWSVSGEGGDLRPELKAAADEYSEFYKHNGFQPMGESHILYAFIDL